MCHQIKNKAINEIKLISLKNILLLYQRIKEPLRFFNGRWIRHYSELCVFPQFYALHSNIRMSSVNVSYS